MPLRLLFWICLACLLLPLRSWGQESGTRPFVVSPLVGEVIDAREKATYGLFPTYSANNFLEARFVQSLAADSAVTLQISLQDGRVVVLPYSPAELLVTRQLIEARQQELETGKPAEASVSQSTATSPTEVIGRSYSIELNSGTSFIGELVAIRATELEFKNPELGQLLIQRSAVRQMVLLSTTQATRGYESVGNGTRVFFSPTARNLRRGEGYVQSISIVLLGANYGITDHFSVGILLPAMPFLGVSALAITPKVSVPVSEKFQVGAGVLYARTFGFFGGGLSGGVGYGVATYGSADNNVSMGLGYGFSGEGFAGNSPIVTLGGMTRISRRFSLLNETYFFQEGFLGLLGARASASRISGSLGFVYGQSLGGIYPAYAEVAYRFGKIK